MFRVLISLFFVATLVFSSLLNATVCTNPFIGMTSQFQLSSKLVCRGVTSPVVMAVSAVNVSAAKNAPYLTPGCEITSPYFNLKVGSEIIDYSDLLVDALDDTVRVSQACNGERIFLIERNPELLDIPGKAPINTCHRVFAEDDARTLLAYVVVTDDLPNSVTLRNPDGSVAAVATKSYRSVSDKHGCYEATWTVVNINNSEATATIMSYIVLLNDNANFACIPVTTSDCHPENTLATIGKLSVGAAVGASVASAVFFAWPHVARYYKSRGR